MDVVACGLPGGSVVKNLPVDAGAIGDMGSVPGLGRFPGGGNGNPLQFFPEESHGQRSLGATVHESKKSQARLSDSTMTKRRPDIKK